MSQEADRPEQVPVPETSVTGTPGVGITDEFTQFYMVCRPKLLRFVQQTARPNDLSEARLDAEGVVHDTFEQALRKWDRIEHPERWIFRVAARKVQQHAHREWNLERRLRRDLERARPAESGPDPVYTWAVAHHVVERIMTLPTNQRIATYLHHVEQWTGREIADLLGVAPGTVGAHIHRGVAFVRSHGMDRGVAFGRVRRMEGIVARVSMAQRSIRFGCGFRLVALAGALVSLAAVVYGVFGGTLPSLVLWIGGCVVGGVALSGLVWAVTRAAREVRWRWKNHKRRQR